MTNEIELKLETGPQGAEALLASGLLGACRQKTLHATYYDTPDHVLRRHGLTLRIRRSAGAAIQTAKSGEAGAGLFARQEWELPVADDVPVADPRSPLPELLGPRFGELAPQFEVVVTRRVAVLREDGAEIEAVVDEAEIRTAGRCARFHEVELELLSGPESALFDLARRIGTVSATRLGTLSKAERGYRLLGPLSRAIKAGDLALDRHATLPAAFASIAADCLRHYLLNEAILLDQPVPEAIHQARVGLRRLRSAMVLFRPLLPGPERAALNARLRDLAQVLGEARDLDVLSAETRPGLLLDRLTQAREAAYAGMTRTLHAPEARLLPLDVAEWLAAGAWRHDPATAALRETPLRAFAADALDRLRRKADRHGRHLAALEPEARHRLRKDVKKLRYAVEFLGGLFDKPGETRRRKAFGKALARLQEDLGALNDHATAEARMAALGMAGTEEAERFLAQWDSHALLKDAAKARHALLEAKPFWR